MNHEELAIEPVARQTLPTLRDIAAVLFRQKRAMLIAFCVMIGAAIVSGLWTPKYEAQMKILVLRQRSDAVVSSSVNAPSEYSSDQISEEDLNSEVELLNSEDLLRTVVLRVGLAGKPGADAGKNNELEIARAARQLGSDLKIEPLRKTNVISVRYQARNPQFAAQVLQTLSAAYREKHQEVHRSSDEFKFFDQQTQQYKQGLDQAQQKLTDFTKGTGVVSAEVERDSALRQANEFDATARQTQAAIRECEHRVEALQAQFKSMQPRMTTVIRTSDNPQLLQQLKSTLLNLELKRTELLTKYEPTYRLVQEVDQQIAETRSSISEEESKPIREESSDTDPNYQWVRGELTKAQADLSGLKARGASAASTAAAYHLAAERIGQSGLAQQDLLRAAKTQEENYLLYVHKREEARISDALDKRGILNVALAEKPVVPALPSRSLLGAGLLTLLVAGMASLASAFVVDFMDVSFRTPDEVAQYLGIPVLASLPRVGE